MNAWKIILAALVIYVAGIVSGGLAIKMRQDARVDSAQPGRERPFNRGPMRPDRQMEHLLGRLDRDLQLSAEQRQQIEVIMKEGRVRMRSMWQEIAPLYRKEFQSTNQRISDEVLNPEQKVKFKELLKNRSKAGEHRRHRRGEDGEPPPGFRRRDAGGPPPHQPDGAHNRRPRRPPQDSIPQGE